MSSAKWSTDIRVTVRTKKKRHVLYGIGSETAYCVTVDGHRYRCGYPVLLDATRVYDVYIDEKVAKSPLLFVETGVVLGEIDTRVRFVPETLRTDRVQRVESAEEIEGMGFDFVFLDAKEIEGYRKRREFNVCVKGVSNGPFDAVDGQYVSLAGQMAFAKALADAVTLSNSLHAHMISIKPQLDQLAYQSEVATIALNISMRRGRPIEQFDETNDGNDVTGDVETTTTGPHAGISYQRLRNIDATLPADSRLRSNAEREDAFRRGRLPHYDPIATDIVNVDDFVVVHNRVWIRSSLIIWLKGLMAFGQPLRWPTDLALVTPDELTILGLAEYGDGAISRNTDRRFLTMSGEALMLRAVVASKAQEYLRISAIIGGAVLTGSTLAAVLDVWLFFKIENAGYSGILASTTLAGVIAAQVYGVVRAVRRLSEMYVETLQDRLNEIDIDDVEVVVHSTGKTKRGEKKSGSNSDEEDGDEDTDDDTDDKTDVMKEDKSESSSIKRRRSKSPVIPPSRQPAYPVTDSEATQEDPALLSQAPTEGETLNEFVASALNPPPSQQRVSYEKAAKELAEAWQSAPSPRASEIPLLHGQVMYDYFLEPILKEQGLRAVLATTHALPSFARSLITNSTFWFAAIEKYYGFSLYAEKNLSDSRIVNERIAAVLNMAKSVQSEPHRVGPNGAVTKRSVNIGRQIFRYLMDSSWMPCRPSAMFDGSSGFMVSRHLAHEARIWTNGFVRVTKSMMYVEYITPEFDADASQSDNQNSGLTLVLGRTVFEFFVFIATGIMIDLPMFAIRNAMSFTPSQFNDRCVKAAVASSYWNRDSGVRNFVATCLDIDVMRFQFAGQSFGQVLEEATKNNTIQLDRYGFPGAVEAVAELGALRRAASQPPKFAYDLRMAEEVEKTAAVGFKNDAVFVVDYLTTFDDSEDSSTVEDVQVEAPLYTDKSRFVSVNGKNYGVLAFDRSPQAVTLCQTTVLRLTKDRARMYELTDQLRLMYFRDTKYQLSMSVVQLFRVEQPDLLTNVAHFYHYQSLSAAISPHNEVIGVSSRPYAEQSIFGKRLDMYNSSDRFSANATNDGNADASGDVSDVEKRITVHFRVQTVPVQTSGARDLILSTTQFITKNKDVPVLVSEGPGKFARELSVGDEKKGTPTIYARTSVSAECNVVRVSRSTRKYARHELSNVSTTRYGLSFAPIYPDQMVWGKENWGYFRDKLILPDEALEDDPSALFPLELFGDGHLVSTVRESPDWRKMTRYSSTRNESSVRIVQADYLRSDDVYDYGSRTYDADVGCTIFKLSTVLKLVMLAGNFAFGSNLNDDYRFDNGVERTPGEVFKPDSNFDVKSILAKKIPKNFARLCVVILPVRKAEDIMPLDHNRRRLAVRYDKTMEITPK
jgi:hypothetical protein